jgi:hypothetical protein
MSVSQNLILTDLYINGNLVDLTSEAGIKECKVFELSGRLVKRFGGKKYFHSFISSWQLFVNVGYNKQMELDVQHCVSKFTVSKIFFSKPFHMIKCFYSIANGLVSWTGL